MGTSTSVAQLTRKFDALVKDLENPRPALNATGQEGKRIFRAHAARAGVLGSSIAGKRKAIGVRYDYRSRSAQGSLVITYVGPAHLVANPTKPHEILPRRRPGSRRRSGARALTIGGNVRARASHPGTKGKDFARKAKAEGLAELPAVLGRTLITVPLRRIFGA